VRSNQLDSPLRHLVSPRVYLTLPERSIHR
jgi:hypothetical protein